MIIKCKICKGSGRLANTATDFFGKGRVCPACKGAGELELLTDPSKLTTCKLCGGSGVERSSFECYFGGIEVCSVCKGIGVVERPTIGSEQIEANEVKIPQTPRLSSYDFDIAVSFAGEDRGIIQKYCDILCSHGLKVFYDKYEQIGLWGANLYDKLDEVYRTKALFCVIFISKHYATKVWTNHERKSAQARALQENREYVLPVRLDDTEIQGIPPTVGYVDLRKMSIEALAEMTFKKVKQLKHESSSSNTL